MALTSGLHGVGQRLRRARQLATAAREQGWAWTTFRARYALQSRLHQRWAATPLGRVRLLSWSDVDPGIDVDALRRQLSTESPWFAAPADVDVIDGDAAVAEADAVCDGQCLFFGSRVVDVGSPPAWDKDPESDADYTSQQHWRQVSEFGAVDVKRVWELSRFSWVFALVRGHAVNADARYAQTFWAWFDDWMQHHPPSVGIQWRCGQEASMRLMAVAFGAHAFASSSTIEQMRRVAQLAAHTAERVEDNLDYAIAQRNNHASSEGAGLVTAAAVLDGHPRADAWRRRGLEVLQHVARVFVYDDGAFAQHSTRYHHLMLQTYAWCMALLQRRGESLGDDVTERVQRASAFLYLLHDATTGQVPNTGQNDGAWLLPLSACARGDVRPTLQALHVLHHRTRVFDDDDVPGVSELAQWLVGREAGQRRLQRRTLPPLTAPVGGHHTLRSRRGMAYVRCGTHVDRPSQCDMLHVDVWCDGDNVASDPGTVSYNEPPPYNNPLAHTWAHNTVVVDGQDQTDKLTKFIWSPRVQAFVLPRRQDVHHDRPLWQLWEGGHNGYRRLPCDAVHQRCVIGLPDEVWLVLDEVRSQKPHQATLCWQVTAEAEVVDVDAQHIGVALQGQQNLQVASDDGAHYALEPSFRARSYLDPVPAQRLTASTLSTSTRTRFVSLVVADATGPEVRLAHAANCVVVHAPTWRAQVELTSSSRRRGAPESLAADVHVDAQGQRRQR